MKFSYSWVSRFEKGSNEMKLIRFAHFHFKHADKCPSGKASFNSSPGLRSANSMLMSRAVNVKALRRAKVQFLSPGVLYCGCPV